MRSRPVLLILLAHALVSAGFLGAQDEEWQVVQPGGLRWTDLKQGDGEEAVFDSDVTVHYEAWLSDGKKFDSSLERGEPFTFTLGSGRVIEGWDVGFLGMKVGGKRRLQVPPELGWGDSGAGDVVPPNATLLFEVELLGVRMPLTQSQLLELAPGMGGEVVEGKGGLQWIDLQLGEGEEAKRGRTVSMHYTGWLEDGTKFDSSRDRGTLFSFELGAGQVIQGWDKGIVGMKAGGRRQLIIPSKLGYGKRGAGRDIPPNADLVFEVELVSVRP